MSLNETGYTSFQIKPSTDAENYQGSRCVFRGDAFCIDSINFISAVGTLGGINHFFFTVELEIYTQPNKVLKYSFDNKAGALRSQRELTRAYTRTEEFRYVRPAGMDTVGDTASDKG